jgi:acyl dehydratase
MSAPVAELATRADFHEAAPHARYVSEWTVIDQARVERFADATGDHQWIHVDPARAERESPFGGPIAHGFLTLALVPKWLMDCVPLRVKMSVNYGCNRVRFMSPVKVGAALRASFAIEKVIDVQEGGVQVFWHVSVEVQGVDKPACVVDFITLHYF